jgi:hypothetical protein
MKGTVLVSRPRFGGPLLFASQTSSGTAKELETVPATSYAAQGRIGRRSVRHGGLPHQA